jgi:hypothetical protein
MGGQIILFYFDHLRHIEPLFAQSPTQTFLRGRASKWEVFVAPSGSQLRR